MVLGFAEMLDDDRPDKDIWLNDDKLVEHFEQLKAKRAEQASGGTEDEDWDRWEEGDDVETNSVAAEWMKEVMA